MRDIKSAPYPHLGVQGGKGFGDCGLGWLKGGGAQWANFGGEVSITCLKSIYSANTP